MKFFARPVATQNAAPPRRRNRAGHHGRSGLCCAYHGWKFATAGNCLETPNLPPEQDVRGKVQARAYPPAGRAGLVYTYMGEREKAPPLPPFEALLCPPDETLVACRQRECNWVRALEGDLDPSHFSFLHTGAVKLADIDPTPTERFQVMYRALGWADVIAAGAVFVTRRKRKRAPTFARLSPGVVVKARLTAMHNRTG